MSRPTKKFIYKGLFILASIAFIFIFFKQFGSIANAVETLAKGSWYFMIAVFALVALAIVNRGAFYHSLYDFFGVNDSLKRLIILSLASNFVNLAAPTAGLSGMAIFISEAEDQGMTKSRATFVNIFAQFLIYGVFLVILLFGLFYLLFNHQLHKYQVITAAILFGIIFFALVVMFIALESAARLKKLFRFVQAIVNFVTGLLQRREVINESHVHLISQEIRQCLGLIERNWKKLWLPVLHVFLMEAIEILILYYLFLAFRYPIYAGILITVYAIAVLFSLISITPSGIGIVEATMILVLSSLAVPVETSTIVVVGYRIFTYWIPFVLGYFAFRIFQKTKVERVENGSR
ncbi:MAG: flippase-like domain-containing protein [Candidatus Berkelbacteria bacterium]|nr:flippase-like domain-containing protein [Candidatus Berkelbacteria bacterium]